MPQTADGTIQEVGGRAVIRFERRVAHPVERVWDAITRPEEISRWWCGVNEAEVDLVEGGAFVMDMHGPPEFVEALLASVDDVPESLVTRWTILRVEAPLVFEYARTDDPDEVVRWELEPDGDGCRLVVTHALASRAVAEKGYLAGWHLCLELLAESLDGRPVDWRVQWSGPRVDEIHARYAQEPNGTIEEVDGGYVLRFERRFAHPVERVWDAITRTERIAEWWLPFDAEIELELVEGGRYVMRLGDPDSSVLSWTVLRVEPPFVFEHTHDEAGSVVRWELERDGEGCRLVLTQTGASRANAVERHYLSGLHVSLERLGDSLAGRPAEWSWSRWEERRDRYAANETGGRR